MAVTAPDRNEARPTESPDPSRQVRQAEEMLFSGPQQEGFAKALFRGEFRAGSIFPYPELPADQRAEVDAAVAAVRRFADEQIDAAQIDRDAEIPESVVRGLAGLGVLGMCAPKEYGGRGFNQSQYCRVMEVIGGHDASTAVFVNAHHSIGIRALVLFGSAEQKAKWLPPLCRGEKIAAFALTEEMAGSDAANVRTQATPTDDGRTFVLNGSKRYITNGGIADVLTVMARTPDPKGGESKVTAFLVTPDLPGFEVIEARMPKCGIRGTATGKLAFHDMPVPAENVLGPLGKGLRVALTVLDFGRTTFGASCTGAIKSCLAAAVRHANRRKQFDKTLGEMELVKKKIALIAAHAYAMEATTYETAALIDRGAEDYMLETAILKVFSTEALWDAVYETMQIHGGQGYFLDEPYERWMRDARINQIGEGANEVLKAFIALVGLREMGEGFKSALGDLKRPSRWLPMLWRQGREHAGRLVGQVDVPVKSAALRPYARALARRVGKFSWACERSLVRWARQHDLAHHEERILLPQYDQERIANAAIALTTAACTLARLDRQLTAGGASEADRAAAELYLRTANRRFDEAVHQLSHNDDRATTRAADAALTR